MPSRCRRVHSMPLPPPHSFTCRLEALLHLAVGNNARENSLSKYLCVCMSDAMSTDACVRQNDGGGEDLQTREADRPQRSHPTDETDLCVRGYGIIVFHRLLLLPLSPDTVSIDLRCLPQALSFPLPQRVKLHRTCAFRH